MCSQGGKVTPVGLHGVNSQSFLEIWRHFDVDDNGYIEGKELDHFFTHLLTQTENAVSAAKVTDLKQKLLSEVPGEGRLKIHDMAALLLPEDETFLLLFKRDATLDNTVDFIQIWHKYDKDSSGCISSTELKDFLRDLLMKHGKVVPEGQLSGYTSTMMQLFDKNNDGRLDLNDMARILNVKENFLLQFQLEDASQEERCRDFEKIFSHYDVSNTGTLEGAEVEGFAKDMMELVRPSLSTRELTQLTQSLLKRCDSNQDGKIQKWELGLILGVRLRKP
uniref:secretagogin isoform X1 n=1 Tax=Myxine glutinosa TaxID=7769 RepID=UPI00358F535E